MDISGQTNISVDELDMEYFNHFITVKQERADLEATDDDNPISDYNPLANEILIKEEPDTEIEIGEHYLQANCDILSSGFVQLVDDNGNSGGNTRATKDSSNEDEETLVPCSICHRTISKRNMQKHASIHVAEQQNIFYQQVETVLAGPNASVHVTNFYMKQNENLLLPCCVCQQMVTKKLMSAHLSAHVNKQASLRYARCHQRAAVDPGRRPLSPRKAKHQIRGNVRQPHQPTADSEALVSCAICHRVVSHQNMDKHLATHVTKDAQILNRAVEKPQSTDMSDSRDVLQQNVFCGLCNQFIRRRHQKRHFMAHNDGKPSSSQHCDRTFAKNEPLETRGNEKLFSCPFCPEVFRRQCPLKSHVLTHTSKKPYECPHCDRAFTRRYTLKTHLLVHEKAKLTLKSNMRTHLTIRTKRKSFTCSQCDQCFNQYYQVKSHIAVVHMKEKPSLVCSYCGQSFSRKCYLKMHILTHERIKQFSCHVCAQSFSLKGSLRKQMSTHTQGKPLSCPRCEHSISQKKAHVSQRTRGEHLSCHFCRRSFADKQQLETHILNHNNENCFQCSLCDKKFTQQRYLKMHSATHRMDKP